MKVNMYDCVRLKDGREGTVYEIDQVQPILYHLDIRQQNRNAVRLEAVTLDQIERIVWKRPHNVGVPLQIVHLCKRFAERRLSTELFVSAFEHLFFDHREEFAGFVSYRLETLMALVDAYEPNVSLREADDGSIDGEELRRRIAGMFWER